MVILPLLYSISAKATYLLVIIQNIYVMMRVILSVFAFILGIFVIYLAVVYTLFPLKYKPEIREFSTKYGVDSALVAGVIKTESDFRADAVSPKGAVGLMQIMPATAEYVWTELMDRSGEFDLLDARTNIEIGTCYLGNLMCKFGDKRTAIAAYNAGEGNVAKWVGKARALKSTPFKETNDYIERVLNAQNVYKRRI